MNRFDKKIIVFTFIAIISFWLVDTFVDYVFHYDEAFSEVIIGSPKEIAFRSLFSICFLIFGIYLSKVVRDLKNSQESIGKERLQSEEQRIKFESMLSAIGDGISIQDLDFKVLYQNEKHKEMVKGDKKGLYCYEEYANSNKVCDDCPVEKSFKDGGLHSLVKTRETDKGKEYFEIVSSPLLDSSGEIIGGIEAVRDITGRMRLEESLEFSQEYLSKIIESVPETILLVDSAGKVLDINPAGVEMGEADSPNEIIGRSLFSFVVPEHHDSIHSFVDTVFKGEKGTIECEIITFKGNRRIISASAMTFYDRRINQVLGVAVVRDITEHRKMEDQLAQSQKMEAIGTFTSGVAHEFNNVLTSIIGYGELMQDEIGKNAMLKTYLNAISSSAERGVNLTKGLLAYCRKQSIHLKPLLLSSVFAEVRGLIEKIIGENIELNISLPDDIAVYADRSQIEQVLINLATNARDAMPDGGVIDINVDSIEIDSDSDIVDRGSYALITFSDTGQGMDKKTLQNIFEPFFTTKDVGKGTGLGLAMAYGIIKKHNGGISVNSEPGKGTTLKIYLPKVAIPSDATAVSKKEELKGGEETILIAEDDDRVRVLIKIMLEKYGYKVIECKDGESAVNRYLTNRDKISFCILDVVMPNKNGKQVHDEIVTLDPDMKVLFISGYSADIIDTEGLIKENLNFLYKPISPSELLKKVREMLDR